MESPKDVFNKAIDKAYTSQPNVQLNTSTVQDAMNYKMGFKESEDEDFDDKFDVESPKSKLKKKSAKDQFTKDIMNDPDYVEFKKNAMRVDDNKLQYSFGTPRADKNDPFIKKKKYKHVGKEESKEATGSGSVGAYSAPVFGGNDEFWEKSKSETPSLKESDVEKVEATEATTTGSSGAYETPAMWAKSTKKKDWGPSRKTQYPGGSFVKVKEKCTKFPYCNQGDINALKLSKNESVQDAIKEVSKKMGLSEDVIITILEHEYQILNKRTK